MRIFEKLYIFGLSRFDTTEIHGVQGKTIKMFLANKYLTFFVSDLESVTCNQVLPKYTDWPGSKNEWIPSLSNL